MAEERGPVARLIEYFADLPGIGRKSAERLAYHVLGMSRAEALAFADAIRAVKENLRPCKTCFNLAEGEECVICRDPKRDRGLLCVVEQVRDLLALEEAGGYRGLYHVLQGRVCRWKAPAPTRSRLTGSLSGCGRGLSRGDHGHHAQRGGRWHAGDRRSARRAARRDHEASPRTHHGCLAAAGQS